MNPDNQRRKRREITVLMVAIAAVLALAVFSGSDSGFAPTGAEQAVLTPK